MKNDKKRIQIQLLKKNEEQKQKIADESENEKDLV